MEHTETHFTTSEFLLINIGMTPNERLRDARLAAGYKSASSAAKAIGVAVSTYIAHENGQNAFNVPQANQYASAFMVSAAWLLTGEGEAEDGAGTSNTAREMLLGLPGITDPEKFVEAYELARYVEQKALGGRGDKQAFAALVSQIYKLIVAGRKADADGA